MENNLPPDVVNSVIDILSYVGAILLGWVAKWLQKSKNKDNAKK